MCPLSAKFHPLVDTLSAKKKFKCLAEAETAGVYSPKSGIFQLKGMKWILSWEDPSVLVVDAMQKLQKEERECRKLRRTGAGFALNEQQQQKRVSTFLYIISLCWIEEPGPSGGLN